MKTTKKRVFITGASGFTGSHLARRLLKEDWEVHILIRPSSDMWRLKGVESQLKKHTGNLRDFKKLKNIIQKVKPNGIFHLAVANISSGVTSSAQEAILDNLVGTANLVDASLDINYDFFVNTGSFLEYGVKKKAIKETDQSNPPEIYSITKLASELYCASAAKKENKPIVTIRPFTAFGPTRQKGRLTYEIITKALMGADINLSSPKISRDFIYVKDIVSLYIKLAKKAKKFKGETFNAGSGKSTTIGELLDIVMRETKSKSKIKWGSHKGANYDSDIWQADMRKTRKLLQWKPEYSLKQGLRETIAWYKK